MKRKLALFLTLCLVFCSFAVFDVNAETALSDSLAYMVKTAKPVDMSQYSELSNDFFGIQIKTIEDKGDNTYLIRTDFADDYDANAEYLREQDGILGAQLVSYIPEASDRMIILRVKRDLGGKLYITDDVYTLYNINFDEMLWLGVKTPNMTKEEALEEYGYLEFIGMIDDINLNPDFDTVISMLKFHDDIISIEPLFSDLHPDFNYKSIDELTYRANEILIKTNRYIDLSEISKNYNMVCGVIVSEARLLLDDTSKENALKVLNEQGYLEYFIKAYCSLNTIDTVKYLNTRSDVVEATPYYVPYEPNIGLHFHDDEYEYEAHVVLLHTDHYIEPFEYTENAVDFYGVPLRELELIHADALYTVDEWLDMGYDLFYATQTDESMGVADAVEILSDVDGITNAFPSGLMYPDIWLGTRTPGDVNDNGEIDMTDYILLKRVYFGTYTLYDNAPVRCDVNMDDKITMMDYILLKRIYFGTYTL